MRDTRIIMGMPITVEVVDAETPHLAAAMARVFDWFAAVDARFSTYKPDSEIMRFNRGEVEEAALSADMQAVFALARDTERASSGFFNMRRPDGLIDPSGIVKGWAIHKAAQLLREAGCQNFYVDAGGDIQSHGLNAQGEAWRVGLRSPFHLGDIIKVVAPRGRGIATSGSSVRGAHIWNPHAPRESLSDIVAITVIGPDVLEADRFATAAFAMGADGVYFIESLPGFEAYQVNAQGLATQTSQFQDYVIS